MDREQNSRIVLWSTLLILRTACDLQTVNFPVPSQSSQGRIMRRARPLDLSAAPSPSGCKILPGQFAMVVQFNELYR
jgi:hypothetical protein